MQTIPQLSDLSSLAITLQQNPFGALVCLLLAVIVLVGVVVLTGRDK